MLTVTNVLRRLPPDVASTLREPVQEVLTVRTGPLLWFGAIVGLWTATSFVETIRDILRRAYGVKFCAPFWEYRLGSILLILGAVLLLMVAFAASAALTIAHHLMIEWFPLAQGVACTLGLYRLVPAVTLCSSLSTSCSWRSRPRVTGSVGCRKWPGALLITAWWLATVEILPNVAQPVRRL